MKYITYNNQQISKLSLGTVQFGLSYGISNTQGRPSQQVVNDIVNYVWNNGINCFDTAGAYGNSESVLGLSLKGKNNPIIISKLKSDLFLNNTDEHISTSLNNLNVPNLYGLLLHDTNLLFTWKERYNDIVQNLKNEKRIQYFGISIYTNEEFEQAINNNSINFIQIPFNIFDQRAIKFNWFEKAAAKNKLLFIRSIFLQGLLLMNENKIPDNLDNAKKYIKTLNKISSKYNIPKQTLALNFVDTIATNSLILFGCDNLQQAKGNISTFNNLKKLDNTIVEELKNNFENIDESIYNPSKW